MHAARAESRPDKLQVGATKRSLPPIPTLTLSLTPTLTLSLTPTLTLSRTLPLPLTLQVGSIKGNLGHLNTVAGVASFCGDGIVQGAEQCDDGNTETERCAYGNADCIICDALCQEANGSAGFCGDGVLSAMFADVHAAASACSI